MKDSLVIPGIFNIIASFFWIMLGMNSNMFVLTIGVFVLVSGILCIMYSKLNPVELYERKGTILVFGILLLPINFISSIILLADNNRITSDYYQYLKEQGKDISNQSVNNVKVTKEVKKLDFLLKLGIAMITIAGIMIATTSWDVITDFVKMIIIAIIGLVFLGLSYFSDKKLKIRGTTITYWLLSMIAFSLSIFMIGNYEILGSWFAISGDGEDIFIATLILIISLFSYITYKKFDLKSCLYGTFLGIILSITLVVHYISQEPELSLLIVTIILTTISFLPKSESKEIKITKMFAMIASFVTTVMLIVNLFNIENEAIVWLAVLIQIANLVRISISEKNDTTSFLSAIGIMGLITVGLSNVTEYLDLEYTVLVNRTIFLVAAILICTTVIRNHKRNNLVLALILPFLLATILFEIDVVIALYIGVIALGMILLGVINKEYKAVYTEGIIFLILNLVIQLWDLWGMLPLWAYLLIGGLTLIGVVTFKELKKEKNEVQ